MSSNEIVRITLGANLRTLMRRWNTTQMALAEMLGLPKTTFNHYVVGKTSMSYVQLLKLSDVCGVPVDTLLRRVLMESEFAPDPLPAGKYPPKQS